MQKLLIRPKRLQNETGKQEISPPRFANVIYRGQLGKQSRLGNELRFLRLQGYTHIVTQQGTLPISSLLKQVAPHLV